MSAPEKITLRKVADRPGFGYWRQSWGTTPGDVPYVPAARYDEAIEALAEVRIFVSSIVRIDAVSNFDGADAQNALARIDAIIAKAEGKDDAVEPPQYWCRRCSETVEKIYPLDGEEPDGMFPDIRVCGPCLDHLAGKYGGPAAADLDRRKDDAE